MKEQLRIFYWSLFAIFTIAVGIYYLIPADSALNKQLNDIGNWKFLFLAAAAHIIFRATTSVLASLAKFLYGDSQVEKQPQFKLSLLRELLVSTSKQGVLKVTRPELQQIFDENIHESLRKHSEEWSEDFHRINSKVDQLRTSTSRLEGESDWSLMSRRMTNEIERLSRSSIVNLLIGVFTTIVAITLLAVSFLQLSTKTLSNPADLGTISYWATRLSIAIFTELFSFFFLRLYKNNQSDIKYFQNELTNVEMRCVAVREAKDLKNEATLSAILKELSKTERNRILQKGERTSEIASDELEVEMLTKALQIARVLNSTDHISEEPKKATRSQAAAKVLK